MTPATLQARCDDRRARRARARQALAPGFRHMHEPSPDQSSRLAAREAGLRYATDDVLGFSRRKRGKGFSYLDRDGNVIRDAEVVSRIRSIVIPPAWTD